MTAAEFMVRAFAPALPFLLVAAGVILVTVIGRFKS